MIEIESGGLTLLESTSFMVAGLGETRLKLTSPTESLTFVLNFLEGPDQPPMLPFQPQIKWEAIPPDVMRIELTGWNSPFPGTLTEPARVGTFNKRALYVLFAVVKVGTKGNIRQVTFSAYLGGEVPDGAA